MRWYSRNIWSYILIKIYIISVHLPVQFLFPTLPKIIKCRLTNKDCEYYIPPLQDIGGLTKTRLCEVDCSHNWYFKTNVPWCRQRLLCSVSNLKKRPTMFHNCWATLASYKCDLGGRLVPAQVVVYVTYLSHSFLLNPRRSPCDLDGQLVPARVVVSVPYLSHSFLLNPHRSPFHWSFVFLAATWLRPDLVQESHRTVWRMMNFL